MHDATDSVTAVDAHPERGVVDEGLAREYNRAVEQFCDGRAVSLDDLDALLADIESSVDEPMSVFEAVVLPTET